MKAWIIPMSGKGTRTKELGECKPAIQVCRQPIVAWCIRGIARHISFDDIIFIGTTKKFEHTYHISEIVKKTMQGIGLKNKLHTTLFDRTPDGPAKTVYGCIQESNLDCETIIVNADQFIDFYEPPTAQNWKVFLPAYYNNSPKSSYLVVQNGIVKNIVEKQVVSTVASAGVYGFKSMQLLIQTLKEEFKCPPHVKGEYYVGPSINRIIRDGGLVIPVPLYAKYDLGNVQNINAFKLLVQPQH